MNRDGPPRLADGDPTVGSLVRSALPLPPRSLSARQLVKWRIRRTLSGRRTGRRALRPFVLAALLLASGAVLGAGVQRFARRSSPVVVELPEERPRRAPARRIAVVPAPPEAPPTQDVAPEPVVAPAPVAAPKMTPLAKMPARPEAPAASPPPAQSAPAPVEQPPPGEQALLRSALARLRVESDPAASLEALDEHATRFPDGALAPEALALRADVLVQLGLRSEALRVLDDPLLAAMPGAEARLALHGELQAALGHWREARGDFARVIATGGDDAAVERALWGRAVARQQLGDPAGAALDLRECLRRFPRGPFSARAAAALRQLL